MIIRLITGRDIQRIDDEERRTRMLSTSIGLICFGILLVTLLMLMGCKTAPNGGIPSPAFVSDTVRDGVSLGTSIYPDSIPDVRKATTVVCAAASTTTNLSNIDPGALVEAMRVAGVTNQNAKIVVNGAIIIWNRVWSFFDPSTITNNALIGEYANSLCTGMRAGLPPEAGAPPHPMAKKLPPHL